MKAETKTSMVLLLVGVGLGIMLLVSPVTAQNFALLHNFSDILGNTDGHWPNGGLMVSGSTLYGTAQVGGVANHGTVFKINIDGSGFQVLHDFSGGSDGGHPETGLVLSAGTLYGTAASGPGDNIVGSVFKVNTDGTGFTILHSFDSSTNGWMPGATLVLSGNTLYGTTAFGGTSYNSGTVFKINIDGTGFMTLHNFTPLSSWGANSDGAYPFGVLKLAGNTLYGTAASGGIFTNGTIFAVNTDGMGFRNVYNFSTFSTNGAYNTDGALPSGGVALSNNVLYGVTREGGLWGNGTVFAVNTDGTGFLTLHSFTALTDNTNTDGAYSSGNLVLYGPSSVSLVLYGTTLYGAADRGGVEGNGTVFKINSDGSAFATLHSFTTASSWTNASGYVQLTNSDGIGPSGNIILLNNTLYGTAQFGGISLGTIFSISLLPRLAITRSAENVILMWPTNYAGFDYTGDNLQSTTNLVSAVWRTNTLTPVVVDEQNTATTPVSGPTQFFRLSQ